MKSNEFINEDENASSGRIKMKKVPAGYKQSKVQQIINKAGIKKPNEVFVKVAKGDKSDYQLCAFIRAGEKMVHVQNYETGQQEAHPVEDVCIKDGFKFIPINKL